MHLMFFSLVPNGFAQRSLCNVVTQRPPLPFFCDNKVGFNDQSINVLFKNRVPEHLVKSIMWQTLQAVSFCHKHNVSPLNSTNDGCNAASEEKGFFLVTELSWDEVR